jgi:DNA-binding MarR family transcriptional regulator
MDEALCRDLGFLTARAYRAFRHWLAPRLEPFGITHEQFALLTCLWAEEGVSQTALAARAYVDETSLTRMLQRMEEADLVERREDPEDQRVNLVYLSPAARDLEERVMPLRRRGLRQAVTGLTDREVDQLHNMLEHVFHNLASEET